MSSYEELLKIPYDAPVNVKDPGKLWRHRNALKGTNSKTLTEADVPIKDLTGKWIIISGANNGIGREAALFFAKGGANIILACRDPPPHETHPNAVVEEAKSLAKAAGRGGSTIEWWQIDMTKLSTVEAFAKRWNDTGRPLDILCNNAGMGGNPGGLATTLMTTDGFEFVHQVNFTSHVLLTMLVLPSLAKAPEPRVVCTTSNMTFFGIYDLRNINGAGCHGVEFYSNNKLYFQTWLTEFQDRLIKSEKYKHITVNGVHPGYVNTGIWNLTTDKGAFAIVAIVLRFILQLLARFIAITPYQGSFCITNAATSLEAGPDPKVQGVGAIGGRGGGRWYNRIWPTPNMPYTQDPDCKLRIWRIVNDELKLSEKGLLSWTY